MNLDTKSALKELRRELLSQVGKGVATFGFREKPVGWTYFKKTPVGNQALLLTFVDHRAAFDVSAHMAVRFDAVEALIKTPGNALTAAYSKNDPTFGVEMGNYLSRVGKRWPVRSEADIGSVAESVVSHFKEHALPYCERYYDLETAFSFLSSDDPSVPLHSPFRGVRAMRVVAMAMLLGKERDVLQLIKHWDNDLVRHGDFALEHFRSFVDTLGLPANSAARNS